MVLSSADELQESYVAIAVSVLQAPTPMDMNSHRVLARLLGQAIVYRQPAQVGIFRIYGCRHQDIRGDDFAKSDVMNQHRIMDSGGKYAQCVLRCKK
jgi:hypothetical protein